MLMLELCLLGLTLAGCFFGGLCIGWARAAHHCGRALWGRRLFVGTLLVMGMCGLVAAGARANALVPLGILSGLLVVAMVWESPLDRATPTAERPT
jgi:hypothetical protein